MKTPSQPQWAVMPAGRPIDARMALVQLYWAAVRAVAPGPALTVALERISKEMGQRRVWIIAIGKAANPMAIAAVDFLAAHKLELAGGVIVAPRVLPAPHPRLGFVAGDHPLPGARSLAASEAVGKIARQVKQEDEVWVLLSGGATSLMAAPDGTLKPEEMLQLFELLLGSGLDIATMNLIRKRFTRWSAGRLSAALSNARTRNFIVSDVVGDDLAAIGSGPCSPDPSTATEIRMLLQSAKLWDRLLPSLRKHVASVEHDPSRETPKPGDNIFANVERKIIASNRVALDAAAARARELGYEPRILGTALAGEAAPVGKKLAATLISYCGSGSSPLTNRPVQSCLLWGGETTVTMGSATGLGGRCQELALAAAHELATAKSARGATLLACGTDGRDGPTDAAGAIVDKETWGTIAKSGRDPAADLAAHDSHPSLDAAGALLRTDLTATNVMDIVIGVCAPPANSAWPPRTPAGSLARLSGSFRKIIE
jgi:glycerate 2-kinase